MPDNSTTGIVLSSLVRPPLREAFTRAREFIEMERGDRPTKREIWSIYRAAQSGGCIFFRCHCSEENQR